MIRIKAARDGSCALHTMGILYSLGLQHRLDHNPNQPFPEDSITAQLQREYQRTMPNRDFHHDHAWIVNTIIDNQGVPTEFVSDEHYWHFVSTFIRVFHNHRIRRELTAEFGDYQNHRIFDEHLAIINAQEAFGVNNSDYYISPENIYHLARILSEIDGFELTRTGGDTPLNLTTPSRNGITTPEVALNENVIFVNSSRIHWELKIAPIAYLECIRSKLRNKRIPAYVLNIQPSLQPAEYLRDLITKIIENLENQDSSLMAYIPAVARRKREKLLKFHQQKLPVIKAQIDEHLSKLDPKNIQWLEDILTKLAVLNESETERLKTHGIDAVSSGFLSKIVDTIIDILLYLCGDDPNRIATELTEFTMFSNNTEGPTPPAIACH